MKILYVAMKYDYGHPEWGLSFEHCNFFDALSTAGHEVVYFDYMTLLDELGRKRMNRRLLEIARSDAPDLMFTVLHRDELDPVVVRAISTELSTVTLNWFCDDHWRFEDFTSHWAPCFNWSVTTASSALPKYARLGYANVIKSQWACNEHLYRKLLDQPLVHDVSFVGNPHGNRREIIQTLRSAGIDVLTRGRDWEAGRASHEQMIQIFNQSRINLNLSNASRTAPPPPPSSSLGRAKRRLGHVVRQMPLGDRAVGAVRFALHAPAPAYAPVFYEQIKGRNFEVPGCGGFMLTGHADDIEAYYEPGREIALYHDLDELVEQIRHFLDAEDERARIAEAGYLRTLEEHTYRHRFEEIFHTIGLPAARGETVRPS